MLRLPWVTPVALTSIIVWWLCAYAAGMQMQKYWQDFGAWKQEAEKAQKPW